VKSKIYSQSKQLLDKNQRSKFCKSSVKRTHFQNLKKKGKWFFWSQGHFKLQKKSTQRFQKPEFHLQKHSGGAVKTWHVHAINVNWFTYNLNVWSVEQRGKTLAVHGSSKMVVNEFHWLEFFFRCTSDLWISHFETPLSPAPSNLPGVSFLNFLLGWEWCSNAHHIVPCQVINYATYPVTIAKLNKREEKLLSLRHQLCSSSSMHANFSPY